MFLVSVSEGEQTVSVLMRASGANGHRSASLVGNQLPSVFVCSEKINTFRVRSKKIECMGPKVLKSNATCSARQELLICYYFSLQ